MASIRRNFKLGKAVPVPIKFRPTERWVENGALILFDPHLGVCKRSPLTPGSPITTMYFEAQTGEAEEFTGLRPEDERPVSDHRAAKEPLPRRPVMGDVRRPVGTGSSRVSGSQPHVKANQARRSKGHQPKSSERSVHKASGPEPSLPSSPLRRLWSGKPTRIVRFRLRLAQSALVMLAVIALAVIGYPWLPAIQYQIFSHTPAAQPETIRKVATERPIDGNRVIIPKIGVDTPILEGSSLDVLNAQEGVWHQTGGQGFGNFVLAGHRFKYLPPNTSTLYSLDKLEPGDTIAVDWAGQRTIYQVEKLKTIGADDVSILNPTLTPKLTIYTCTDKKQTQRTVAIAVPLQNP